MYGSRCHEIQETLRHFCNVDDEKLISNGTLISESIKEFLKGKGYKY